MKRFDFIFLLLSFVVASSQAMKSIKTYHSRAFSTAKERAFFHRSLSKVIKMRITTPAPNQFSIQKELARCKQLAEQYKITTPNSNIPFINTLIKTLEQERTDITIMHDDFKHYKCTSLGFCEECGIEIFEDPCHNAR